MVGWTLGAALGGGEPNWTVAGIGAGHIGVAIPFSIKANREAKKSVTIYNENPGKTSFIDRTTIDLRISGNTVGLLLGLWGQTSC